jgi:hypothetical protein
MNKTKVFVGLPNTGKTTRALSLVNGRKSQWILCGGENDLIDVIRNTHTYETEVMILDGVNTSSISELNVPLSLGYFTAEINGLENPVKIQMPEIIICCQGTKSDLDIGDYSEDLFEIIECEYNEIFKQIDQIKSKLELKKKLETEIRNGQEILERYKKTLDSSTPSISLFDVLVRIHLLRMESKTGIIKILQVDATEKLANAKVKLKELLST